MKHELLFEIGVEEVPALYLEPALDQLARGAAEGLSALRLEHGAIRTFGTPRRLALEVRALSDRQRDLDEEAMGPAVRVAYDADGKPTRALLGFCAGKGVSPDDVRRVSTPKGEYVAVSLHVAGRRAAEVLPAMLAALATRISFPKTMRWLADDTRFARPVRWLLALLGDRVLKVEAFGLEAGRESRGHRFLAPGAVALRRAADYEHALERAFVIVDPAKRAARLRQQLERESHPGRVVEDSELVNINNWMVEWPTVFRGDFDPKYKQLPNEVLVTAMREHQRFFAVEDTGSPERNLLRHEFLAVRNGDERGLAIIRRGSEDVLVARLEDALFYWETDLKKPPAAQIEALRSVVWMEGLGSLYEKSQRLQSLAGWLAQRLAPAVAQHAERAALLCKTDLLSEMIGSGKEYAGLQGVIGAYYAQKSGEPREVCDAIYQHYQPRWAGDTLPKAEAGAMLSLADKLDHVAGAFVAGKIPSGSEDPYGVRRAANGAVRILVEQRRHLDLRDASMESTRPFFAADPNLPHAEIMKKLGEFWRGRVEAALDERGAAFDARDAALEARVRTDASPGPRPGWIDPCDALERAAVLGNFRSDPRFAALAILFKRVSNILSKNSEPLPDELDRERLGEPVERALVAALDRARASTDPLWRERRYADVLPPLLELESPIHAFFDGVLVNAEDRDLRLARFKLLSEVRNLFLRGWDISRIVVEGEKSA
ncbi:MAG: glycine--tRNA ligase subunit beta [Candidatus Eiseniibacteriota bacterium]